MITLAQAINQLQQKSSGYKGYVKVFFMIDLFECKDLLFPCF